MHSLRKSLRKKPFSLKDRTLIYLCHRLRFEFPEKLKLFGNVLHNTDDYTYVESRQYVLSFSQWAHHFLALSAKCTSLFETDVFSPRSERFVIFALGAPLFSDFQQRASVCPKSKTALLARYQHVLTFSHWAHHFLAIFSKGHQFVQNSVFCPRLAPFLIFAPGAPLLSCSYFVVCKYHA